jgi:hypothetical protein
MKINTAVPQQSNNIFAPPALEEILQQPAEPPVREPDGNLAAVLERSKGEVTTSKSGLTDNSGNLMSRLVRAQKQDMVRLVISEAYKSLGEWLKASMGGDSKEAEKAFAVIKRLNRVIRRATRKVADLNKEDVVRRSQKRAEKKEREVEAKKFRAELKRRIAERKLRENSYLREVAVQCGGSSGPNCPNPMSLDELQAKIQSLAAELNALAMTADIASAPPGDAAAGGGEAAVTEGGEGAVAEIG